MELNLGVEYQPVRAGSRREAAAEHRGAGADPRRAERGKRPSRPRRCATASATPSSGRCSAACSVQAADYTAKHPDSDCEAKLHGIDWEQDKILLFVGRADRQQGHPVCARRAARHTARRATRPAAGRRARPQREPMGRCSGRSTTASASCSTTSSAGGATSRGRAIPEPLSHLQRYFGRARRARRARGLFKRRARDRSASGSPSPAISPIASCASSSLLRRGHLSLHRGRDRSAGLSRGGWPRASFHSASTRLGWAVSIDATATVAAAGQRRADEAQRG